MNQDLQIAVVVGSDPVRNPHQLSSERLVVLLAL